jgi:hypothetical protein
LCRVACFCGISFTERPGFAREDIGSKSLSLSTSTAFLVASLSVPFDLEESRNVVIDGCLNPLPLGTGSTCRWCRFRRGDVSRLSELRVA